MKATGAPRQAIRLAWRYGCRHRLRATLGGTRVRRPPPKADSCHPGTHRSRHSASRVKLRRRASGYVLRLTQSGHLPNLRANIRHIEILESTQNRRGSAQSAGLTMCYVHVPGSFPQVGLQRNAVGRFLRTATGIAKALGKFHQRGLVHKDIKPANILVDGATGEVRLTGFGIASRLPRERQAPAPPEVIAGTLAYMAPEQTGRMNRSIAAISMPLGSPSTRCSGANFPSPPPIRWNGCTATLPANRRRPTSGYPASRGRPRRW